MPRAIALPLALAAALLAGAASAATGPTPAGPLTIIDADTFDVAGTRVRLHGVDAPEAGQECRDAGGARWPCGAWATAEAWRLWGGRDAACEGIETDRYGRLVARCAVDGEDLVAALVAGGIALAYRDYSLDYVPAEEAAMAVGAGVWAGTFERPHEWRAARRAGTAGGCDIKGNLSDAGRVYHLPGGRSYDRTRIDEGSGERWFCSEPEALAAGWRAPL